MAKTADKLPPSVEDLAGQVMDHIAEVGLQLTISERRELLVELERLIDDCVEAIDEDDDAEENEIDGTQPGDWAPESDDTDF